MLDVRSWMFDVRIGSPQTAIWPAETVTHPIFPSRAAAARGPRIFKRHVVAKNQTVRGLPPSGWKEMSCMLAAL
jgi:hypothetical protein